MSRPNRSAREPMFRMLCLLVLPTACGCCSPGVHVVSQTADGGVIAIPNDSDQWPSYYRSRAEQLLKKTCPNGYAIVHEEVVPEGTAPDGKQAPNDDAYYDYSGALVRISRNRPEEYHITFRCAPPAGTMPPIGAMPPAQKLPPTEELPPPTLLPSLTAPR